jgi:hypothetical protein
MHQRGESTALSVEAMPSITNCCFVLVMVDAALLDLHRRICLGMTLGMRWETHCEHTAVIWTSA